MKWGTISFLAVAMFGLLIRSIGEVPAVAAVACVVLLCLRNALPKARTPQKARRAR